MGSVHEWTTVSDLNHPHPPPVCMGPQKLGSGQQPQGQIAHLCQHAAHCPGQHSCPVHLCLSGAHRQQHDCGRIVQRNMHLHVKALTGVRDSIFVCSRHKLCVTAPWLTVGRAKCMQGAVVHNATSLRIMSAQMLHSLSSVISIDSAQLLFKQDMASI